MNRVKFCLLASFAISFFVHSVFSVPMVIDGDLDYDTTYLLPVSEDIFDTKDKLFDAPVQLTRTRRNTAQWYIGSRHYDDYNQNRNQNRFAHRRNTNYLGDNAESQKLKEENDALKCQMEAFKNEVGMVRQEGKAEVEEKDKQVKALQNALQGMQKQLISLRATLAKLEKENQVFKSRLDEDKQDTVDSDDTVSKSSKDETSVSSSGLSLTDKEAKMIGLICCFLHVHPHGATVDYLWSYLLQMLTVKVREVEDLLEKIPSIFQQEIVGVGAGIERRWIYTALNKESFSSASIKNLESGV